MSQRVLGSTRIGVVVALVVIAALIAGCGDSSSDNSSGSAESSPNAGGTLKFAQNAEVITLDPTQAIDTASVNAINQIMEPLYRTKPDGEVVPWLVEETKQSADGRTWTLQLRDGVSFSDGEPLTADDVVFSLDAARESVNWSFLYEGIQAVQAPSPDTVVIKLKEPVAALEASLSLFAAAIVPADYGGASAKEFAQNPVGTGPFVLGEWAKGQSMTLEKNPSYWRSGEPLLDTLVLVAVPDDNSRISQLRGGQLDLIYKPAWTQLEGLEATSGLEVGEYQMARSDTILLNLRRAPFDDPRVREAINLAIDREGVNETALAGYGEPAASWLPPALLYADPDLKAPARDLAKAKELVAEAEKDGVEPKFRLTSVAGDTVVTTASQILQQNLEEAGFDVTLQPVDESAMIDQEGAGTFDAVLTYFSSDIIDPSELLNAYVGLESLFTGAPTDELAPLVAESNTELDPQKREALVHEIERMMYEENNVITVNYEPVVYGMRDNVAGLEVLFTGIWFANAGFAS